MTTTHKVFLLGLDGATFDLLGPWMEAGHLPNLKRLAQEGVWGELTSTRPPTTAPAWVSCVTGANPGQHGVFDFRESPLRDPRRPLISSQSVRTPTLWRILNHHGRQVGLLNVPVSYPPAPVEGFVVGGMMSPGPQSNYTHPDELRAELNARGYVIDVEIQKYDVEAEADAIRFLDDVAAALQKRAEALFHLMNTRPWQFLMAVFVAADRIQHLFWKTMADPESQFYHAPQASRLRARILTIYQALDGIAGQVMGRVDADGQTDLFVVSDHGFGSTKAWFNVNHWLQRQGWLHLKPGPAARKRLFYEAMQLNDSRLVKTLLPEPLGRTIRGRVRSGRSVFKTDLDECIDWTRTRAFFASIPAQGIYIHVKREACESQPDEGIGTVEPGAEYEKLRQEIRDRLLALSDPRSGEHIVDRVWFREELYHGQQTHLAPDVLFVARNYGYLGRELLGTRGVIETSMNWANGFHRMNGILMAYGPHVRRGMQVDGATMVDVAPTVLYDLGLPVPANMDGRVLTDVLDPSYVDAHPIRHEPPLTETDHEGGSYTENEQAEISGRLAALGYIE
jgi:predicted AlkP superfamily phosphohydrolase/phosphomutase